uniref:Ig-like domain-containing protein n=1 Tax=Mola mola TaxID=94237 RepID=A0A3Q4BU93_MOLML
VGSDAKFECEIEDAPNVTFKWWKSGIEIKQSEKYRILSGTTSSSLEILNPIKADSSEYTCKASNQHGTESCRALLVVTGKIPVGPFEISDAMEINSGLKHTISSLDSVASLEIVNCTVEDSGEYVCVASSEAGSDRCSCTVTVKGWFS